MEDINDCYRECICRPAYKDIDKRHWYLEWCCEADDVDSVTTEVKERLLEIPLLKSYIFHVRQGTEDTFCVCMAISMEGILSQQNGGTYEKLEELFAHSAIYVASDSILVEGYCSEADNALAGPFFYGFSSTKNNPYIRQKVIACLSEPHEGNLSNNTSELLTRLRSHKWDQKDRPKVQQVYLLKVCGKEIYKIGTSKNVSSRISGLESTERIFLDKIATCYGGYELEKCMHTVFEQYRVRGAAWSGRKEWFSFPEAILSLVISLFVSLNLDLDFTAPDELLLRMKETPILKRQTDFLEAYYLIKRRKFEIYLILDRDYKIVGSIEEKETKNRKEENKEELKRVIHLTSEEMMELFPLHETSFCWCKDCTFSYRRSTSSSMRTCLIYDEGRRVRNFLAWGSRVEKMIWVVEDGPRYTVSPIPIKQQILLKVKSLEEGEGTGIKYSSLSNVNVKAAWVSIEVIAFECPFCWLDCDINGRPYNDSKPEIHRHTLKGAPSRPNYILYRRPHCVPKNVSHWGFPNYCLGFAIEVTKLTRRKVFTKELP